MHCQKSTWSHTLYYTASILVYVSGTVGITFKMGFNLVF